MAFMEQDIQHGDWYEVDGPACTEWIPAELADVPPEDLDNDEPTVTAEEDGSSVRIEYPHDARPIPAGLGDFCENRTAWSITKRSGWGARLSAPGYLDCTDWTVFDTEAEAQEYLDAETEDEDEEEEEDEE